jgi:hypothetical protein
LLINEFYILKNKRNRVKIELAIKLSERKCAHLNADVGVLYNTYSFVGD